MRSWAEVEARVPMTLERRFQLSSMTKPITAVAALILVEKGRLALDDRVDTYLPSFANLRIVTGRDADGGWSRQPLAQPIRVRHLLTFTSGIGGYAESDDRLDQTWRARNIEAADLGSLAQRVVEIAAGERYDEFLERRIFAPLGMHATVFPSALPADVPFAKMHTHAADGSLVRDPHFDA